jgi:hypothetical protein
MSQPLQRRSIKDLELSDTDEITLNLELIRIIEKDIDDIKAEQTRTGWTNWAVIGAMAAAILLFFGETRKLSSFPLEEVKTIGVAGLLLITVVNTAMRLFLVNTEAPRPGRIKWSTDAFRHFLPSSLFALFIYIGALIVVVTLTAPRWARLLTLASLGLIVILRGLGLLLSLLRIPTGVAATRSKVTKVMITLPLLLALVSLPLWCFQLPSPVGEAGTVPYVLSGLILAFIVLTGSYLNTMAPPLLLASLQDLRDDMIFLRLDMDEALRRYEVLTQGETLPEVWQEDLRDILRGLDLIEYTYSNMETLIGQMAELVPTEAETDEERARKIDQYRLDKDSLALHNETGQKVWDALKPKLTGFPRKVGTYSAVAGDVESADKVHALVNQRLNVLTERENRLNESWAAVEQSMTQQLSRPASDGRPTKT